MSVDFEENQTAVRNAPQGTQASGMAQFFIDHGVAKNVKQANFVMLGIIAISVVIFFIAIFSGVDDDINKNVIDPAQIDQIEINP